VGLVIVGALIAVIGIFAIALEHHRNPAHVDQIGNLETDHRKLAMWVFLGSECFFFGTLIATYMAYRGRSVVGPYPHEVLNIPITTLSTFDLLMSSLLMVLALAAVQRLTLQQNLFGSTFFVLTGFHGAHVTLGVLWLLTLWVLDLRGRLTVSDSVKVEIAGLYWHFVDIVWIVLFTLIYLVP
jgi:heme/copper-type cytochrome/quinol oxidase subunit 3